MTETMRKYRGLLMLAGLLVAVPWIAYRLAIADTVRMGRELRRTETEIARLQNQAVTQRSAGSVALRSVSDLQSGDLIPRIMDCEAGGRCVVVKYTPYITESRDGLAVHTAELVLSGTYADLLRLIERIEERESSCRLVSATFRSITQRQRRQTQLHVTLILQQITKL
jgi:hypothetical protein